jgi:hypothetical protein
MALGNWKDNFPDGLTKIHRIRDYDYEENISRTWSLSSAFRIESKVTVNEANVLTFKS